MSRRATPHVTDADSPSRLAMGLLVVAIVLETGMALLGGVVALLARDTLAQAGTALASAVLI